MATLLPTATPPILTSENDPFSDVEQKINLKFNELIEAVTRRREQLLTELRELREQFKDANLGIVHEIDELETSKTELTQHCRETRANVAKLELEKSMNKLEQQINDLKRKLSSQSVEVELSCDTQKLEQAMAGLGKICVKREEKVIERDYSLIKSPRFRAGKSGGKEEELNNPGGLCIDNSTDLVYIADRGNQRIQVWTLDGDYVITFGEEILQKPTRVEIIINEALFVCDCDGKTIFKFKLSDFSLLSRSDHKLAYPCGICSDSKEVFVCDKNKIFVFNTDLKFLKMFQGLIELCYDINTRNSILFLSEFSENKIHLLDSNTGDLIKTVITNWDGVSLNFACHFCLDQSGNFLITDWKSNQIKIVRGDGTLLSLINTSEWKLSKPQGIGVSRSNKIAIVFGIGIFSLI